MIKIVFLIFAFFVNGVIMCKWVCIDKNNNIKKHYFDQSKFDLAFHKHEITIPKVQKNGLKGNKKVLEPIPEVTLKMPEYEVLPLKGKVSCNSKEFTKQLKDMTKKTKCKPRDTIVDIKYRGAKQITPSRISTKLCEGVCTGTKSCLSVESRNITVAVSVLDGYDQAQCSNVLVPEDVKCKCGCDKKPSDCLPSQVFDKKFCKCKCVNDKHFRECMEKMNNNYDKYEWNKDNCSCQCKHEYVCSTGTYWSKTDCKCAKKIK